MLRTFLVFCFLMTSSYAEFDWQGHRGARGLYPENSLVAMEEALKYPITTLEMDVVISKDHKVLLSHEPWTNPEICEGDKKNLYQLDYADIAKIDCGLKKHPRFPNQKKIPAFKPLLSDVLKKSESLLKKLKKENIRYSIEIKSTPEEEAQKFQPPYQKFTEMVVEEILKTLPLQKFMIQSFDWRVLKYLKSKYPQIAQVALRESPYKAAEVVKLLGYKPEVFSPDFKLLTPEDVKYFHEQGIKVIPWTVNTILEMKKLKEMDVDGIITDYPNLI